MDDVLDFVSFAFDPGATAGWAIALYPEIHFDLGVAVTTEDRIYVCNYARKVADKLDLPIVVVAEQWTAGGPHVNHKMFIGLGKNYGRWLDHIEGIVGVPEADIVRPTPQLWRNGLFGPALVKEHGKDKAGMGLKRLACAFVSPIGAKPVKDHDAAEAACMACWAHCSEEGLDAALRSARKQKKAVVEEDEEG